MKSSGKSERSASALITYVVADDRVLTVDLSDGRRLMMPLEWYPRLEHGTPVERNHWRLIGGGEGVHWPHLDEDLSLDGFLNGRRSRETPASLRRWATERRVTTESRQLV